MGLDPVADSSLMWIAEDLRDAPLPPGWVKQRSTTGDLYFYNEVTGESLRKHPMDIQYKQLIAEHRLEQAMTGATAPPADQFGTMTIRSMEDSLLMAPGAEHLMAAKLSVPSANDFDRAAAGGGGGGALLPQYVLHTVLAPRSGAAPQESVPILWGCAMQQDSVTSIFSLAREAEGVEFACVVARRGCARSTLYVSEDSSGEKEMSAMVIREAHPGSATASVEVIIPMPRADGKAVGLPAKLREDALLAQYEGARKGLVVLRGQVKADARALEMELRLPSKPAAPKEGEAGTSQPRKREPLLKLRQTAGGADMDIKYRDKITPVQAMHVVLVLNRWWTGRKGTHL
mmetsp:Transcript_23235/g.78059  ORF Transcript_23235/g.78059 Transcript_23235/m.78059 type:complete len:345 (-) Transcript_23235:280-1314(-)